MSFFAEPLPRLDEGGSPPEVLGTACLTTAAMHGAEASVLAARISAHGGGAAARLYDEAIACQLAFRRADGLALQDEALAKAQIFRVARSDRGDQPRLRLLALMLPGDLMANTPLDFLTAQLDVRLDLLFLLPDRALPSAIPDHDVMIVAASEPDTATRARLERLFAAWPRPALNDPRHLPLIARDRLHELLARLPGLCSPPCAEASRAALDRVAAGAAPIASVLEGGSWPVLLRPYGSHAGTGLKRIDGPEALASYLLFSFAPSYYVTAFEDYRSPDGLFRKYRVAFIDREPLLCHMAASQHWMVHYLNAGMTESAEKRDDEARAMAGFDTGFAARHRDAFARLCDALPFDYFQVDCGETRDGHLLVFEADTAAIVHVMDPVETFPYKHAQMRRVFERFEAMLRRRAELGAVLSRSQS